MFENKAARALRMMDRIGKATGVTPLPSEVVRVMVKGGMDPHAGFAHMLSAFREMREALISLGYEEGLQYLDRVADEMAQGAAIQNERVFWSAFRHRGRERDKDKVFIHVRLSTDEKRELARRAHRYFGSKRSITKYVLSVIHGDIPMRVRESYADVRDDNLIMKFTLEEKRLVESRAEREGYNFSEYIRNISLGDEKNTVENLDCTV